MKSADKSLPRFDAPPVVEMVLGVEFADLSGWSIPHYGLFWGRIRSDYLHCTVKEPLLSQLETFAGPGKVEVNFNLPMGAPLPIRCWYSDQNANWLIQIQPDRFIQNWRKTPEEKAYSYYSQVRQRFEKEFQRFKDFVSVEKLGELEIRQCEITYVNHIEPAEGGNAFSLFRDVVPFWSDSGSREFLPEMPEVTVFRTSYVIPENRGRLHLAIQPVFRHADAKDLIQMTVTAKVKTFSSDINDVLAAFDLGHDWAVQGFTDYTSEKMHQIWHRRQGTWTP